MTESISVRIALDDKITKSLESIQQSLSQLHIPPELTHSVEDLAQAFDELSEYLREANNGFDAFRGLEIGVYVLAAGDAMSQLLQTLNVVAPVVNSVRIATAAVGGAFVALAAIDMIGWLLDLGTGARETAEALEKVRDVANGFRAQAAEASHLADRYFELRGQANLTTAEQAELEAVSERLAKLVPEYAREIRNLTGDYEGLATAIESTLKFDLVKNLEGLKLDKQTALFEEIFKLPELGGDLKIQLFEGAQSGFEDFSKNVGDIIKKLANEAPKIISKAYSDGYEYTIKEIDPDSVQAKLISVLSGSLGELRDEVEAYAAASNDAAEASRWLEDSQRELTKAQEAARAQIDTYKTALEGLNLAQMQSRLNEFVSSFGSAAAEAHSAFANGDIGNAGAEGFRAFSTHIQVSEKDINNFIIALNEMGYTVDESFRIVKKAGEDAAEALTPFDQAMANVASQLTNIKTPMVEANEKMILLNAQIAEAAKQGMSAEQIIAHYGDSILSVAGNLEATNQPLMGFVANLLSEAKAAKDAADAEDKLRQQYAALSGEVQNAFEATKTLPQHLADVEAHYTQLADAIAVYGKEQGKTQAEVAKALEHINKLRAEEAAKLITSSKEYQAMQVAMQAALMSVGIFIGKKQELNNEHDEEIRTLVDVDDQYKVMKTALDALVPVFAVWGINIKTVTDALDLQKKKLVNQGDQDLDLVWSNGFEELPLAA